ncbi:MAG: hypothetical protein R3D84_15530 [Paracoccaceae bacterium]
MKLNRAQRRAMRAQADTLAARLAKSAFNCHDAGIEVIAHPVAVAALHRAFRRSLEAGGKPVALPLSHREAEAFPGHEDFAPEALAGLDTDTPAFAACLAVGLDPEGRGAFAVHRAVSTHTAGAHEAARSKALARLRAIAAEAGFPLIEDKTP